MVRISRRGESRGFAVAANRVRKVGGKTSRYFAIEIAEAALRTYDRWKTERPDDIETTDGLLTIAESIITDEIIHRENTGAPIPDRVRQIAEALEIDPEEEQALSDLN